MDEQWDQFIEAVSGLLEGREKYQRTLGQLMMELTDKYGVARIKDFSSDLREQRGLTVSTSTLRNYRWVYEKTHNFEFPEDISYRTLQYIAASGEPEYWSQRIAKEGLSSVDVYKLIRTEKGLDKKPHAVICPECGHVFNLDS